MSLPPDARRFIRALVVLLTLFQSNARVESAETPAAPVAIPDLICFWDFQAAPSGKLTSKGAQAYTLEEMNGPIVRAAGGVFGPTSLKFEHGQWLRLKRADCPALNLTGRHEATMVAWIQRRTDTIWQFIAGVWDERNAKRQYALFTSGHKQTDAATMERTDAHHQGHGYVSDVGGATPGKPFCFSYATGATTLKRGKWQMIAFTYDLKTLKVFVNGELDQNGNSNPFVWDKPILDPGREGADFTVAQRDVRTWPTYPEG